jgi:hypothetical protein
MANTKVIENNLLIAPKGVEITPVGLKITARFSREQYQAFGTTLQAIHRSILWWAGDLLVFGERTFGEEFAQAIGEYSKQTLCNAMWVSSRIELSRRLETLSWSHHQEVASLEPRAQDKLLKAAVDNNWNVHELRQAVRAFKGLVPSDSTKAVNTRVLTRFSGEDREAEAEVDSRDEGGFDWQSGQQVEVKRCPTCGQILPG